MLPLNDLNPSRRTPLEMYILIGINILVFIYRSSMTELELFRMYIDAAVVPLLITRD